MDGYLEPVYRHLKKSHSRGAVGVDLLTVTPVDDAGNTCLIVIVVFYTKYVWATPAKDYTAHTVAVALFTFFFTFGMYDELWSDPGSDLMAEVVQKLSEWMGIKRVTPLVDRHESNGVEGYNKQILCHLRTLVHDLQVPKKCRTRPSCLWYSLRSTTGSTQKLVSDLWMLRLGVTTARI